MIDAVWLRDNLDLVRAAVQARGANLSPELDIFAELEARRRRLLPEIEGLKQEQNAAADEVAPTRGREVVLVVRAVPTRLASDGDLASRQ